ncbi:MAG TPA: F0F1 ATP synthase subunit B [Myxococcota bacterium]|jgi:F-type H+-transporting ATPase subunit b
MARLARTALATAALVLMALPAHAEGGAHGGARDLFYALLNFALLIGVLLYFARKPISDFFGDRRRGIQEDLKAAADVRTEAEARYAKWQRRLMDLESELAGIRQTARERAAAEREQILADATAGAERIRRDAIAAVDQELRRARAQLRQEAADLAVELARETLRRQITGTDQDRLLDEFVTTIERAPAAGPARPSPDR